MSKTVTSEERIPTSIMGYSRCDRWTKGERSARARIDSGVVIPEWKPSFEISPDDTIFAVGSCFARNVEKALIQRKAQVTSVDPNNEVLEIRTNLLTGLLNKYNPISIHQELEWASGHTSFPEGNWMEFNGKYYDLTLRDQARKGSLEMLHSRQVQLQNYFQQAFSADVVILTLGLTETWFDRTTRTALAEVPSPRLLKAFPERFGCKLLKYSDCEVVLNSIYALLKQYGKATVKIIVTVSPVPMERTFSGQDIIVANMMSKSILRSAAGAFAVASEGVDYFPSYEAVILSNPKYAWEPDRRNVSEAIVASIMNEFTQRY